MQMLGYRHKNLEDRFLGYAGKDYSTGLLSILYM